MKRFRDVLAERDGAEEVDPVPLEAPAGHVAPPPLRERIQAMVRQELSDLAEPDQGSFDEEDDFEEEDPEGDILSGHQILLMDPEELGLLEELDGLEAAVEAEKGAKPPEAKETPAAPAPEDLPPPSKPAGSGPPESS